MDSPAPLHVLVVDDEKNIRVTLSMCLESLGCQVVAAPTGEAAVRAAGQRVFDLAFVDLRLGASSGLQLIPELLAVAPALRVVVITAYATIDTAVEAMRRGAWDYLPKPFTPAQIGHLTERAGAQRTLSLRLQDLEQQVQQAVPAIDLGSCSPVMNAALQILQRAAASDATVLLRGENGTGKGVLARALHGRSPRAARPFVVVSCPTLSEELLASELFGHARGAFTGAVRDQPGRVEAAQGGTLFLDELGELSPSLQAKLLRFLQDREFERVGEGRTRRADVRVVAATNRDLEAAVQAGGFREDLLYRLNVIEVRVPALRERPEDILPLSERFLDFFARTARRPGLELSPAAREALQAYAWPGNVRELRNAIERATILWPARLIEPEALPRPLSQPGAGRHAAQAAAQGSAAPQLGGDHTLETVEREHILRVIARTSTLDEAARVLGIDASTLWRKRKRYEG